MLSLASASLATASTKAASLSYIALYSTVSGLARRKWKATGPKPQSLLFENEDEYESRTLPEEPKPGRAARLRSKATDEPTPKMWAAHREAMKKTFPEGWAPPRKLSRDAMDGLRMLHAHDPEIFSTSVLAEKFKVSPEAVRRILRSKWEPTREHRAKLVERERHAKREWVVQKRSEEREQLQSLLAKRGRVLGTNKSDKLSLT
ncbi:hypothetical protein NM688_g6167 [Phlebia brevispora]|uniref:Uncharacterized protein n=1 Tax=Phlebia brevispora TaxID=194682 RepID=A0ACC1SJ84_9APHY|nr:hypothetical protein NM688_g6167 [Phlebia brevispora]